MSLIIAENLTKRFGDVCVLDAVSVQVGQNQRIGLIGPNGSGKTTLLDLLSGVNHPDEGHCQIIGNTRVGYLTQESQLHTGLTLYEALRETFAELLAIEADIKRLEPQLSSGDSKLIQRFDELHHAFESGGGYTIDSRIRAVLEGLQFSKQDAALPVSHLSGGQAARAALAKLLLEAPDVMLLDEPTNHLDMAALAWLEEYLSRWKRAYIIASHDRHLLDHLVDRIWAIHRGKVRTYAGNYTAYLPQRAEELKHQWDAYYKQQAFIQKSQNFIQRNIYDKKTSAQAQSRRKLLEKLETVEKPAKERSIAFEIGFPYPSGKRVFRLKQIQVGYAASATAPESPLFEIDHAILDQGQRVAVIGPNGCGKTTLLKTLAGVLSPLGGTIEWGANVALAYFAQSAWDHFDPEMNLVDVLIKARGWTISKARELLGRFLFSGEAVFKPLSQLSGGERSRVALARLSQLGGNLLLLDEPTNHLDIPAREILETALLAYPGSIVFVSHDRYFIQKLATQIWEVDAGRLNVYKGDYAFYKRKKATPASTTQERTRDPVEKKQKLTPGKLKRLHEREIAKLAAQEEKLTAMLNELETQITETESNLTQASYRQDLEQIQQLTQRYEQLQADREALFAEWEHVLETLERKRQAGPFAPDPPQA